jgi:hypothetical protein
VLKGFQSGRAGGRSLWCDWGWDGANRRAQDSLQAEGFKKGSCVCDPEADNTDTVLLRRATLEADSACRISARCVEVMGVHGRQGHGDSL